MTGHGHAQPMGFVGNRFNLLQFYRAVDFHLLESGIVIAIGPCTRLFGGIDALRADGEVAASVYNSREQQAWAQTVTIRNSVTHRGDKFKFVTAIARGGHSR